MQSAGGVPPLKALRPAPRWCTWCGLPTTQLAERHPLPSLLTSTRLTARAAAAATLPASLIAEGRPWHRTTGAAARRPARAVTDREMAAALKVCMEDCILRGRIGECSVVPARLLARVGGC